MAIVVNVAVEEADLLPSVQRDVGGVEVEDDPLRQRTVRVEEVVLREGVGRLTEKPIRQ